MARLTPELYIPAVYRLALFGFALGIALRSPKGALVALACALGVTTNLTLFFGGRVAATLVGVPYTSLIVWLLIDHLRSDPDEIKHLLARKEAEWSGERHDLLSEVYTLRGTVSYYRDREEPK